jgi:hypothetical protein
MNGPVDSRDPRKVHYEDEATSSDSFGVWLDAQLEERRMANRWRRVTRGSSDAGN